MENNKEQIYVTQPALPPLEEFIEYLKQIWESKRLTNNGPFHHQFEKELAEYLGVKYLSLFTNGTLALVTALQALRIMGEVITTPFSFVATTHSLWWNNIKPVFVDIESDFFTLDPEKIESAITPLTTAIMPVHVYGNPCRMEAIQKIADTYGLKVIYDAAHAFGVKINGNSVLNYGDLSILSFHATKTFNTIEGGAIICHDEKTKIRIDFLKNFGFADEVTVVEPGINAKMNELQAAYGLVQLKHVDEYISKRKTLTELYRNELKDVKGIRFLNDIEGLRHSYTYFPVLIDDKVYRESRDEVYERLKRNNIYGRRYFYPLISQFPTYRGLPSAKAENLPVATKIAEQVICLPIYPSLETENIDVIISLLKREGE
ncbi:MAG: DegT/DnrJ/EryC1/StrS family aminotransferase [Bacteroidales bacterium]|nr:DegT/DnrJ/EryC1/StrS family aminotransferase [Bacteroidales bacterium]